MDDKLLNDESSTKALKVVTMGRPKDCERSSNDVPATKRLDNNDEYALKSPKVVVNRDVLGFTCEAVAEKFMKDYDGGRIRRTSFQSLVNNLSLWGSSTTLSRFITSPVFARSIQLLELYEISDKIPRINTREIKFGLNNYKASVLSLGGCNFWFCACDAPIGTGHMFAVSNTLLDAQKMLGGAYVAICQQNTTSSNLSLPTIDPPLPKYQDLNKMRDVPQELFIKLDTIIGKLDVVISLLSSSQDKIGLLGSGNSKGDGPVSSMYGNLIRDQTAITLAPFPVSVPIYNLNKIGGYGDGVVLFPGRDNKVSVTGTVAITIDPPIPPNSYMQVIVMLIPSLNAPIQLGTISTNNDVFILQSTTSIVTNGFNVIINSSSVLNSPDLSSSIRWSVGLSFVNLSDGPLGGSFTPKLCFAVTNYNNKTDVSSSLITIASSDSNPVITRHTLEGMHQVVSISSDELSPVFVNSGSTGLHVRGRLEGYPVDVGVTNTVSSEILNAVSVKTDVGSPVQITTSDPLTQESQVIDVRVVNTEDDAVKVAWSMSLPMLVKLVQDVPLWISSLREVLPIIDTTKVSSSEQEKHNKVMHSLNGNTEDTLHFDTSIASSSLLDETKFKITKEEQNELEKDESYELGTVVVSKAWIRSACKKISMLTDDVLELVVMNYMLGNDDEEDAEHMITKTAAELQKLVPNMGTDVRTDGRRQAKKQRYGKVKSDVDGKGDVVRGSKPNSTVEEKAINAKNCRRRLRDAIDAKKMTQKEIDFNVFCATVMCDDDSYFRSKIVENFYDVPFAPKTLIQHLTSCFLLRQAPGSQWASGDISDVAMVVGCLGFTDKVKTHNFLNNDVSGAEFLRYLKNEDLFDLESTQESCRNVAMEHNALMHALHGNILALVQVDGWAKVQQKLNNKKMHSLNGNTTDSGFIDLGIKPTFSMVPFVPISAETFAVSNIADKLYDTRTVYKASGVQTLSSGLVELNISNTSGVITGQNVVAQNVTNLFFTNEVDDENPLMDKTWYGIPRNGLQLMPAGDSNVVLSKFGSDTMEQMRASTNIVRPGSWAHNGFLYQHNAEVVRSLSTTKSLHIDQMIIKLQNSVGMCLAFCETTLENKEHLIFNYLDYKDTVFGQVEADSFKLDWNGVTTDLITVVNQFRDGESGGLAPVLPYQRTKPKFFISVEPGLTPIQDIVVGTRFAFGIPSLNVAYLVLGLLPAPAFGYFITKRLRTIRPLADEYHHAIPLTGLIQTDGLNSFRLILPLKQNDGKYPETREQCRTNVVFSVYTGPLATTLYPANTELQFSLRGALMAQEIDALSFVLSWLPVMNKENYSAFLSTLGSLHNISDGLKTAIDLALVSAITPPLVYDKVEKYRYGDDEYMPGFYSQVDGNVPKKINGANFNDAAFLDIIPSALMTIPVMDFDAYNAVEMELANSVTLNIDNNVKSTGIIFDPLFLPALRFRENQIACATDLWFSTIGYDLLTWRKGIMGTASSLINRTASGLVFSSKLELPYTAMFQQSVITNSTGLGFFTNCLGSTVFNSRYKYDPCGIFSAYSQDISDIWIPQLRSDVQKSISRVKLPDQYKDLGIGGTSNSVGMAIPTNCIVAQIGGFECPITSVESNKSFWDEEQSIVTDPESLFNRRIALRSLNCGWGTQSRLELGQNYWWTNTVGFVRSIDRYVGDGEGETERNICSTVIPWVSAGRTIFVICNSADIAPLNKGLTKFSGYGWVPLPSMAPSTINRPTIMVKNAWESVFDNLKAGPVVDKSSSTTVKEIH